MGNLLGNALKFTRAAGQVTLRLLGSRLVQEEIPDMVVSDIVMPGLDGYALCRAIETDPETDFIAIILPTAKAAAQSELAGLAGGADDYVSKPFDPAELLLRLRNLFRARARLRAHLAAETPLDPTPIPAPFDSGDAAFSERVRAVLDLESQMSSFDLLTLAGRLKLSRTHLHRRVTQAFGLVPAELRIRFRLERTARMLVQRAGNVGQVGCAVGFKDLSHFIRRFRERYVQTPAAYAAAGTSGRSAADLPTGH